jgi:hypothetical protein
MKPAGYGTSLYTGPTPKNIVKSKAKKETVLEFLQYCAQSDPENNRIETNNQKVDFLRDLVSKWIQENDVSLHYATTAAQMDGQEFHLDEQHVTNASERRLNSMLSLRYITNNYVHLSKEEKRALLLTTLNYEKMKEEVDAVPIINSLFRDPQHLVLCILHLLLRTSEKIIKLLVVLILEDPHVKKMEDKEKKIKNLAKCMNSKICIKEKNTDRVKHRQFVTIEHQSGADKKPSVSYSLSGDNFKKMLMTTEHEKGVAKPNTAYLEILRCHWDTDEARERVELGKPGFLAFSEFYKLYIEIMQHIGIKRELLKEEIDGLQDKIDTLGNLFFSIIGEGADETPYFHDLFSGHVTAFLHKHGSLSTMQQQSWEQLMSEIKKILNRCTTKSGCGIPTVDAVFPFCERKILWYINNGVIPNPDDPADDDHVGRLIKEYEKDQKNNKENKEDEEETDHNEENEFDENEEENTEVF